MMASHDSSRLAAEVGRLGEVSARSGRNTDVVIAVANMGKTYQARDTGSGDVEALRDISLEVRHRELVCIVGPSGCGKTTLLHIIAGFDSHTIGHVSVKGQEVLRPAPDRIMVFQSPALFPWLTGIENITFGLRHLGVKRESYMESARELVKAVGLIGFEDRYPYELSAGMMQRVQIARALICKPDVLLMDEPFGPLDAQTRHIMQELLLRISVEYHLTVLFVTHDVEEALFMGDRVLVMTRRPGQIKMEVLVPFPRPRDSDIVTCAEFVAIKGKLVRSLREERVLEA